MKTRTVTLASGETFTVPQGLQRIDGKSTHGWQVRYQGTKFFSDGALEGAGGPRRAFERAMRELLARIRTLPAPVPLRRGPSAGKSSGLPAGISGPILVQRSGSGVSSAVLSVLLPRFGEGPQVKSIYIGSERTYTRARFRDALARAVTLREEALRRYEAAATRARRREAQELRRTLQV